MNYTNTKSEQLKHLQGIGLVDAKKAVDLKINDVTIWNFGNTAKIISKVKETKCFITFEFKSENSTYQRKLKKERLIGFVK